MSATSPHQRLHSHVSQPPPQHSYRNSSSPNSSCSEDDSDRDSQPNDLSVSNSRKHGHERSTFPNFPPFYSPPHHASMGHGHQHHGGGGGGGGGQNQTSPYQATNECRIIEYRGARIAAFLSAKAPCEYLLCLPQAFELFLKHLVGGLHTVYTKLKVSSPSYLFSFSISSTCPSVLIVVENEIRDWRIRKEIRCSCCFTVCFSLSLSSSSSLPLLASLPFSLSSQFLPCYCFQTSYTNQNAFLD